MIVSYDTIKSMGKTPPYTITPRILELTSRVSHALGLLTGAKLTPSPIRLRRENKIKTIQSTLAIEGNTLTTAQISAVLEGKRIIGPQSDIIEVQNALEVYDDLSHWNPLSSRSMLKAHQLLMKGLIKSNGQWRTGGVGVFKGEEVAHMAPPAKRVPKLMEDLFQFIKANLDIPWIIKACIFHYELEFIHPFSDGNGRMGRLWQQLLLMKEHYCFEYIPVEEIIKKHQSAYYDVLASCDQAGDSTKFIEFSLAQIVEALSIYSESKPNRLNDPKSRLEYASTLLKNKWFARKDYIEIHQSISSATASRDLHTGVEHKQLEQKGEKNKVVYRFIK